MDFLRAGSISDAMVRKTGITAMGSTRKKIELSASNANPTTAVNGVLISKVTVSHFKAGSFPSTAALLSSDHDKSAPWKTLMLRRGKIEQCAECKTRQFWSLWESRANRIRGSPLNPHSRLHFSCPLVPPSLTAQKKRRGELSPHPSCI